MHQLGYQADWQREEVQDGGAKQLRPPRSED